MVDDLARMMDQLDLRDAVLVAHSMGSFEAVRYCATGRANRIARLMLAAPATPFSTRTADNMRDGERKELKRRLNSSRETFLVGSAKMRDPFSHPIRLRKPGPGSRT